MSATPNWQLPLLATAQAQKELTHNESLLLIDALLFAVAQAGPINTPPIEPSLGSCWIIGGVPEDLWAGAAHYLAVWTEGGWRFIRPRIKMQIRRLTDGTKLHFDGNEWRLPQAISEATGGSTVDFEARAVLMELVELLQDHGLVQAAV